jgi:hypothetical protein
MQHNNDRKQSSSHSSRYSEGSKYPYRDPTGPMEEDTNGYTRTSHYDKTSVRHSVLATGSILMNDITSSMYSRALAEIHTTADSKIISRLDDHARTSTNKISLGMCQQRIIPVRGSPKMSSIPPLGPSTSVRPSEVV